MTITTRSDTQFSDAKIVRAASIFRADLSDTPTLEGLASRVETPYPMRDMFGEYQETIAHTAFARTLELDPEVVFLINHRGLPLASTMTRTLTLTADKTGLNLRVVLNPEVTASADLIRLIDDGLVREASFAFRIVRGEWDEAKENYRIQEVSLQRGDISAVTYGANPHTDIATIDPDPDPEPRSEPEAAKPDGMLELAAARLKLESVS